MYRISLIVVALLAVPPLQAGPEVRAQANRFALQSSSLEASSGATSDQRFRLSTQLQRHERPAVSETHGMRLVAKLVNDTHGTCLVPALLFRDGFEPAG